LAQGIPARLTRPELRRFGLSLGAAFLALAGLLWWREHLAAATFAGVLGTGLALAGLVIPGRIGAVYRAWMGFALALSRVTTPVFMAVLYFVVLTPIGVLRRLFGGNPLTARHRPATVWVPRAQPRGDLERRF
jgi:hypothetical protein